jgi:hypothetical protein
MSECKHGLRNGCSYCHASKTTTRGRLAQAGLRPEPKSRTPASRLSEKMNDRMTALNRRLREIRGE